jgi:3-hydroxyacyl-CoA dehydrogenase
MEKDGRKVPEWVKAMLSSGRESFYDTVEGKLTYYDPSSTSIKTQDSTEKSISLNLNKTSGNLVKKDWSASLIDLGDSVLNVEFHSVLQPNLNPIDGSIGQTISDGMDLLDAGKYKALILGHQGPNFCAGANLANMIQAIETGAFDQMTDTLKQLQDLTQRIRFSPGPVVAAPFQLTLGGGVELVQPAAHRIAAAETYMGLVEVGVGLIPGGGGNLRMILNAMEGGTGRM